MKIISTSMNIPRPKGRLFQEEFSCDEKMDELLRLLQPFFPDPEFLPSGRYFFKPEEVRDFDALFERFGLAFRSTNDRFDNDLHYLSQLWLRLGNDFGGYIEFSITSPGIYKRVVGNWSLDFQAYLAAVIADDRVTAQRLAKKLEIENLDTVMPGVYG
jgi:hypothetical protein